MTLDLWFVDTVVDGMGYVFVLLKNVKAFFVYIKFVKYSVQN